MNTAAGIAERIRCSLQTPAIKLRLADGEVSDAHHASGLNCDFDPQVTEVRTRIAATAQSEIVR